MTYMMRQCNMERPTTGGIECRTAWIPEQFAEVGKLLRIEDEGVEENGWIVTQVGGRKTSTETNERSRDFKTHRKGSDI